MTYTFLPPDDNEEHADQVDDLRSTFNNLDPDTQMKVVRNARAGRTAWGPGALLVSPGDDDSVSIRYEGRVAVVTALLDAFVEAEVIDPDAEDAMLGVVWQAMEITNGDSAYAVVYLGHPFPEVRILAMRGTDTDD
jgi:hypothetical protein